MKRHGEDAYKEYVTKKKEAEREMAEARAAVLRERAKAKDEARRRWGKAGCSVAYADSYGSKHSGRRTEEEMRKAIKARLYWEQHCIW